MMDMSKCVGPFVGVCRDATRTFSNGRSFRFVLYGAYNAFGLIGPEKNGIAVLDEDNRQVVCDEISRADSGYYGPTAQQLKAFDDLTGEDFSYEDLKRLVNESSRARVQLDD